MVALAAPDRRRYGDKNFVFIKVIIALGIISIIFEGYQIIVHKRVFMKGMPHIYKASQPELFWLNVVLMILGSGAILVYLYFNPLNI